jgi:hypothetical protein
MSRATVIGGVVTNQKPPESVLWDMRFRHLAKKANK